MLRLCLPKQGGECGAFPERVQPGIARHRRITEESTCDDLFEQAEDRPLLPQTAEVPDEIEQALGIPKVRRHDPIDGGDASIGVSFQQRSRGHHEIAKPCPRRLLPTDAPGASHTNESQQGPPLPTPVHGVGVSSVVPSPVDRTPRWPAAFTFKEARIDEDTSGRARRRVWRPRTDDNSSGRTFRSAIRVAISESESLDGKGSARLYSSMPNRC